MRSSIRSELVAALVIASCLSPRDILINKEAEAWTYAVPIESVWPKLRTLVFEQGYQASSGQDLGMWVLETAERRQGSRGSRLMATAEIFADGRCRIRIHEQSIDYESKQPSWSGGRSQYLERQLIQRVEPERWKTMVDAATAATAEQK